MKLVSFISVFPNNFGTMEHILHKKNLDARRQAAMPQKVYFLPGTVELKAELIFLQDAQKLHNINQVKLATLPCHT